MTHISAQKDEKEKQQQHTTLDKKSPQISIRIQVCDDRVGGAEAGSHTSRSWASGVQQDRRDNAHP